MYKKEDIKNIHYNNKNEIQFEYGGQIYHYNMDCLKEIICTCWNIQEQNQKYKEVIDKAIKRLEEGMTFCKNDSQGVYDKCNIAIMREQNILDILKEVE